MEDLKTELITWLESQRIDGNNIGDIRRRCFMPWNSKWNAIVRDETAAREQSTEELSTINTQGKPAATPEGWPCQHTDAVATEGCKATTSEVKP